MVLSGPKKEKTRDKTGNHVYPPPHCKNMNMDFEKSLVKFEQIKYAHCQSQRILCSMSCIKIMKKNMKNEKIYDDFFIF